MPSFPPRSSAIVRAVSLAFVLLAAGCATGPEHRPAEIQRLRDLLPYRTKITGHSMSGALRAGSVQTVTAFDFDRLQSGQIAVFWPAGFSSPVAHYIWARNGTASWRTRGFAASEDWFFLTRDNYIGVIK